MRNWKLHAYKLDGEHTLTQWKLVAGASLGPPSNDSSRALASEAPNCRESLKSWQRRQILGPAAGVPPSGDVPD